MDIKVAAPNIYPWYTVLFTCAVVCVLPHTWEKKIHVFVYMKSHLRHSEVLQISCSCVYRLCLLIVFYVNAVYI